MFTKRIIPCLDVNKGRVVKGVNFVDLKDAGDPVEIAKAYDVAVADELVFLDITASCEERDTVVDMVRKVAANVFIPFTVGGGIRTVEDFKKLLREGADKISVNSAAIDRPELITEAADKFGSQCVEQNNPCIKDQEKIIPETAAGTELSDPRLNHRTCPLFLSQDINTHGKCSQKKCRPCILIQNSQHISKNFYKITHMMPPLHSFFCNLSSFAIALSYYIFYPISSVSTFIKKITITTIMIGFTILVPLSVKQ